MIVQFQIQCHRDRIHPFSSMTYSMAIIGWAPGFGIGKLFTILDDWLKRERFIFIGWSGILLFPTAYLSIGGWFTGTTFITSWYTHGLATSYIEGCNFLTVSVSTPPNCFGHSAVCIWGPEAQGSFLRFLQMGGLWIFIALHALFSMIGFSLRQFEIARLVNIRP